MMNQDDIHTIELDLRGHIELPARGISMGRKWRQATSLSIVVHEKQFSLWGKVLVYKTPAGLVAHRAVRFVKRDGKRWWITKGDGFFTPDRLPVFEDAVIGVVDAIKQNDQVYTIDAGCFRYAGLMHAVLGYIGALIWRPIWPGLNQPRIDTDENG